MQQHDWQFLASIALVALTTGCGGKGELPTRVDGGSFSEQRMVAPGATARLSMAPAATPVMFTPAATPVTFNPAAMLIRTGSAAVEVSQLDSAVAGARQAAARFGGVVANAQVETGRNEVHRAVLQIKVPAARFDSLLAGLAPLGRVESVQVNAQDVGEEYADIQARLGNLRRLEARLIELLANRTGKLSDVLNVERELARVRGEIEQIEGRQRFLQHSVVLSVLQLTLHEPEAIIAGKPGRNPIVVALRDSWRNFVRSLAWGIAALGVLIPGAVFAGVFALAARWARRRLQQSGWLGTAVP